MPPGAAKKKNGEAGSKCLKDRKNWGACFRQVKFKVLVGCPGGDSRGLLEKKIGCSGEDLCLRNMFEKNSLRNTSAIALHTNLQVGIFQQCEHIFHQHQVWVKLQLALHLLLLMALLLYHLHLLTFLHSLTHLAYLLERTAASASVVSDSVWPHRRQPTRLPGPWDSPGKNTGVGCHFLLQCMNVKSEKEVAQSCPILSDPMDSSLPGSSIHGIFQARVLEWSAIAFSGKD